MATRQDALEEKLSSLEDNLQKLQVSIDKMISVFVLRKHSEKSIKVLTTPHSEIFLLI
jgi:hypothetical protein